MPKASERPLSKHTVNLYAGQYEELGGLYPDLSTNQVLRIIIDQHIEKVKSGVPATTAQVPVTV